MPRSRFLLVALICVLQTVCFTRALQTGNTLSMVLWGILLGRNLYRVYLLDRIGRLLTDIFDKFKDLE